MLDEEDQDKVSFITSSGTYCYRVMPFGLKNAGATYQRLVDKMFRNLIGRNMEIYVDDMLVKSTKAQSHRADLKETFEILQKYNIKLNPAKCAFGVRAGKFLWYVVIERGVEVRKGAELSWNDESANAFEKLKEVLASLPLIAKIERGEKLYVYLSIGEQSSARS